ncbi:MAG: DUF3987 domain-containing protein, partial [Bacteroidota bacterium]
MDKQKEFESLPEIKIHIDNEIRFDVSTLKPSNFKKMLMYYDQITMAPTEYILTVLLCAISGAVGKNIYGSFTKSFRVYLNVWAVLCGPSTLLKKTSAIGTVTHDLQRIDELQKNDFKKQKEQYEKEIQNKNSKEKQNIVKPQREYLIFPSDVTVESLTDILTNSKRGLMIQGEWGGWLASLNKSYSQDAKMVLTDFYDVPISKEISRATKGNTLIERPFFSIVGASTVEWIRSNSTQDDLRTGFFSRIIFSIRNRNDKPLISVFDLKDLTYRTEQQFHFNTRDIFNYLVSIDQETIIEASPEAIILYKKYEKDSYFELENIENNDELSFKGRLIIYVLKFAALMALCDKRFKVELCDMENAIVIGNYFKQNIEKLINDELISKTEFMV